MRMLLWLLLLLPLTAQGRVYMCVDSATGKTSFTDRACPQAVSGEELRVDAANLESGARSARSAADKTWNSERDERKTGLDYQRQYRGDDGSEMTAQSDG